jgi:hypothetical protein
VGTRRGGTLCATHGRRQSKTTATAPVTAGVSNLSDSVAFLGGYEPTFKNNIFWNARSFSTPGIGRNYAINVPLFGAPPSSDYDDIYVSGVGGAFAPQARTLEAWRARSGQDAHSASANPRYKNPAGDANTVDLHILNTSPCIGAGIAIPGITVDFDGDPRANPPAIGADEPSAP